MKILSKSKKLPPHQYNFITERIFSKCDVYFKEEFKNQAKYEIDIEIINALYELGIYQQKEIGKR